MAGSLFGEAYKLTSSGTVNWLRDGMCRGEYAAPAANLAINSHDQVYLAGNMVSTALFGSYEFHNLSGGYANDIFIARYDMQGTVQWAAQLGGSDSDDVADVAALPNGNILLAVEFEGKTNLVGQALTSRGRQDLALVQLDEVGRIVWLRQEGGPQNDNWDCMDVDALGSSYLPATFGDLPALDAPPVANSGYFDYVLVYSATGRRTWAVAGPTSGNGSVWSSIKATAVLQPNAVVVLGNFTGTINFPGLAPVISSQPAATNFPYQVNTWLARLDFAADVTGNPSTEEVFIPNIITPNGDADNECLVVRGLDASTYSLTIYSRWGRQVYHTASYQQDWNATGLPSGLYFYQFMRPGKISLKGWVEVLH